MPDLNDEAFHPQGARRKPMAVTGVAGLFPGAQDVDALWTRILSAEPAPMASQVERWSLPRDRYLGVPGQADRAYADAAFNLQLPAEERGSTLHGADPQVHAGRHAIQAALTDAERQGAALARQDVGLVVATSWSAPSYFGHDAARLCGLTPPSGPPHAPEAQLDALAEGLGGPRLAVDTACASSLYALDLAAGLLDSGQARAVVVLGLNVLMPPFLFVGFSKLMALSPSCRIAPFAADASGIVPGECAAALVLEAIPTARAAGRRVAGIVRAVGLASDGAERSIFAPGSDGQRMAYERAYAGLDRHAVDYVEAHGTATTVGDETEIQSLQAFFGPGRDRPLPLGSVKGLIGHTLAAAGIASVIKGLKMLESRTVPPHLPVVPHAGLMGTQLQLPTQAETLTDLKRPMRIGISGFGFGGANAHVVLDEAWAPAAVQCSPAVSQGQEGEAANNATALAVLDFEAAVGPWLGRGALAQAVARGQPLTGCLPGTLCLDAQGLRMGPNFLRRLDPLQLLVTHLARDLAARQPDLAASPNTSIVMTSNLGGAMSLRLSRKYSRLFAGQAAASAPETTVEAIASSLPTMCSGYPAYHLDLRGFHQTLSGDAACFWTALRLAPGWLQAEGQALLLGGTHTLKSPLDLPPAPQAGAPTEAAALFLLKPLAQARAEGHPIMAVLRMAVARPGEALTLEVACQRAGVPAAEVDACLNSDLQTAPLGEANGIDAWISALLGQGRCTAVQVQQNGHCKLVVFIDKRACTAVSAPPVSASRLPLEIPLDPEGRPAAIRVSTATPAQEVVSPGCLPDTRPEHAALRWLRHSSRALENFFLAQQQALALLKEPAGTRQDQNATVVQRSVVDEASATTAPPALAVLTALKVDSRGRRAALVVDEQDRYFFDHSLDHVPGILMAEGIVQLARQGARGHWVRHLSLKFKRFCEKSAVVEIALPAGPEQLVQRGEVCEGQVLQQGQVVGSFEVALGSPQGLPVGRPPQVQPVPQRELLHKRHAENVLVGPLTPGPQGHEVALVSPPSGHRFALGGEDFHDPLYLLETARQAVMLGAHGTMGIPLGLPMNLLGVALSMRAPAARSAALHYRLEAQPLRQVDAMTLADVRAVLIDATRGASQEIGEVRIRAQVVDAGTYARQRSTVAPAVGAAEHGQDMVGSAT